MTGTTLAPGRSLGAWSDFIAPRPGAGRLHHFVGAASCGPICERQMPSPELRTSDSERCALSKKRRARSPWHRHRLQGQDRPHSRDRGSGSQNTARNAQYSAPTVRWGHLRCKRHHVAQPARVLAQHAGACYLHLAPADRAPLQELTSLIAHGIPAWQLARWPAALHNACHQHRTRRSALAAGRHGKHNLVRRNGAATWHVITLLRHPGHIICSLFVQISSDFVLRHSRQCEPIRKQGMTV